MNKSRGRRAGGSHTREEILAVARRRFLAEGYGPVTMRSIAAEAGVDAALISYFFGSKKGLFGAVLGLLANPPDVLAAALPGDPATLPERVLRALLGAWDDPASGRPLRLMVTAATQDPELIRLLRDVIGHEMIDRIAEHIGGVDARGRAAAFGTQLAGVIFVRYVLAVEPVASMPADELIARFAPGLRAALARRTRPEGHFGPVPNRGM
ncbi:TetR family transcriptional regulator [Actinomadura sp. NEAU-AAG7]|uniref:TetR/AcrR family transcriptional regulator n=1 Tax=Actinomadura sp. NEAU-AAG7 TaxID=2839640 RepID=UPI001BE4A56B|nr:TetR family transcriptional regulator [Actinomadura sp. NEAU-AAG7]MBT2209168.1 TetR/AcrR family transcriptional regulator [Actinomadura sp. NEAU-AAG7]